MNHLAHIFLSKNNNNLLVGNFIADFIKGNRFSELPFEIQQGVILHRKIDTFTDNNTLIRDATKLLRPELKKFAGVATDIYFDYFLANSWDNYHNNNLQSFANETYAILKKNWEYIPRKAQPFYAYMVKHNLLVNYKKTSTLKMVFESMDSRSNYDTRLYLATDCLKKNHDELGLIFNNFFPKLQQFVKEENHA